MNNSSVVSKIGIVLMASGGLIIVSILLSLVILGSWRELPEIFQLWGSFIRSFSNIPLIGNFVHVLWGLFLLPGYLIFLLGKGKDGT